MKEGYVKWSKINESKSIKYIINEQNEQNKIKQDKVEKIKIEITIKP